MNQTKPNQTKLNFINAKLLQLVSVFMFLIFSPLFFISCSQTSILESDGLTESENKINKQEITPVTKGGITFKKMSEIHIALYEQFLEKISANSNVISAIEAGESKSENGTLTTDELMYNILDGMCSEKVKITTSKGETDTTIEELGETFITNYIATMSANAPDPTDALTLSGVTSWENGIVIDGDILIHAGTIEGALTIEFLNAEARGESTQPILDEIERLNAVMCIDVEEKGVYIKSTSKWDDGIVYYKWDGDFGHQFRVAVLEAMDDWVNQTGSAVTFKEHSGLKPYVTIRKVSKNDIWGDERDFAGRATVGNWGWFGQYELRDDMFEWESAEKRHRVTRHELGHTIGLKHEHQRWDRDNYLDMTGFDLSDNANFEKYPHYKSEFKGFKFGVIGYHAIYVGPRWFRIRINIPIIGPYPDFQNEQFSFAAGAFDYDSIMIYNGIIRKDNGNRTRSYSISSGDIADIKLIYK